ncbi:hypothetical protein FRACYDRAFT_260018 [Fragilariopsis cylindrus CCMP1102]|uniref:Rhodanese domain-containing protein n=1 Tax=Fragilariopsis cylindrus CCMP1102 TaxID=635003 RepID=A0A1E7FMV5_9STRA|nr:hypothetical protein FRACYDRAFT_260018 [Fragilariopsis cylindrus CCMP1102]|eukprot:OEU19500.1 hypothetical protein FRACYDRAFT_260018 [Fragilariopsis cylindrus CCMP1102]
MAKQGNDDDHDDDDDLQQRGTEIEIEKKKKNKKKKKLKKHKKSKKNNDDEIDVDVDDTVDAAAETPTASQLQQVVKKGLFTISTANIASSAIEFYDPVVKKLSSLEEELESQRQSQRKKNKKMSKKSKSTISSSSNCHEEDEQQQKDDDNNKNQQKHDEDDNNHNLTLLLFYQYIEPEWDETTYEQILYSLEKIGKSLQLTGRMRCAKEGLNCTLTGPHSSIIEYCNSLQQLRPNDFIHTEFKLTTNLPIGQKFKELKVLKVVEIVKYGLEKSKMPSLTNPKYAGVHLEPKQYHEKITENNTVIIDVRNHYEASIGRFVIPENENTTDLTNNGPKWIDPKMRKSTEFPAWLDKESTQRQLKGKQVLMYCTGGIRCERASALLKYKMDTDATTKNLDIKGVFQLQGGIDKYFKEYPNGGYWKGKNYVFDKRFSHAPPKLDAMERNNNQNNTNMDNDNDDDDNDEKKPSATTETTTQVQVAQEAMGKCESCSKSWDMYRGKRRCPTCGVPSLICRDCFLLVKEKKITKFDLSSIRCDLCVEQNIHSKRDYKEIDNKLIQNYEQKMISKGLLVVEEEIGSGSGSGEAKATTETNGYDDDDANDDDNDTSIRAIVGVSNPDNVTRLVIKSLDKEKTTIESIQELFEQKLGDSGGIITHVVWKIDRKTQDFMGMGWIEMLDAKDASKIVALSNQSKLKLFGRQIKITFSPANSKDIWPPSNSKV